MACFHKMGLSCLGIDLVATCCISSAREFEVFRWTGGFGGEGKEAMCDKSSVVEGIGTC